MTPSIYAVPLYRLAIILVPVAIVTGIYVRWMLDARTIGYALVRMVIQLLLVGYVLVHIFEHQASWLIMLLLCGMMCAASWIALRPVRKRYPRLFVHALIAILCGGLTTLVIVVGLILPLDPWYEAKYVIPLAGMIFSNAMNAVSLSAERFSSELGQGRAADQARQIAFQASLIPITNSLFAVGIVALPGMMTGQILSGVSPLIAARYQILVMCMVFSASGIASAVFLTVARTDLENAEST